MVSSWSPLMGIVSTEYGLSGARPSAGGGGTMTITPASCPRQSWATRARCECIVSTVLLALGRGAFNDLHNCLGAAVAAGAADMHALGAEDNFPAHCCSATSQLTNASTNLLV